MNKTYTMIEVIAELTNRLGTNVGSKTGKGMDGNKNERKASKIASVLSGLKRL